MRTEDAIQDDLQHFQVDDDKAGVDYEVHDRHKWVAEHFALAECQQQEIPQAEARLIIIGGFFSEQDIPAYQPDLFYEQSGSRRGGQDEQDLLKKKDHRKIIYYGV